MLVDFHVHSTASDGSKPPAALARKTRLFAAAALTDHDNCDGLAEFFAEPAGDDGACLRVTGVELSVDPGEGFDMFHMLALGFDPEDEGLKALLRRIREGRDARNERIVANFLRIGIDLGGEVRSYARGDILARPHFAKWLVAHKYAGSVREAFAKYLLPDSPAETRCYEPRWRPPQEETFRVGHGAGGLCVMAHPKFWRQSWRTTGCEFAAAERELAAVRERGLDGLEAVYQANSPGEDAVFTQIADRLGLVKTAGSDYHGSNKPDVSLGMDVPEAFIRPILDRFRSPLSSHG